MPQRPVRRPFAPMSATSQLLTGPAANSPSITPPKPLTPHPPAGLDREVGDLNSGAAGWGATGTLWAWPHPPCFTLCSPPMTTHTHTHMLRQASPLVEGHGSDGTVCCPSVCYVNWADVTNSGAQTSSGSRATAGDAVWPVGSVMKSDEKKNQK